MAELGCEKRYRIRDYISPREIASDTNNYTAEMRHLAVVVTGNNNYRAELGRR